MRLARILQLRLRSLFRQPLVDRELNAELQFHIEQHTRENLAKGMTPDDARAAAHRLFGGVAQIEEACRTPVVLRSRTTWEGMSATPGAPSRRTGSSPPSRS